MIIGITGTMASGKSSVSKMIKNQGYSVYDTDKMVHKYYDKDSSLYYKLLEYFGTQILNKDKSLNRQKLAGIVFNDDESLDKLESLVFPVVLEEMKKIAKDKHELLFFEVPLLFEAEMEDFFDRIIVIDANERLRIQRAIDKGLNKEDIERRMSRQLNSKQKKEKADFVVLNNNTLDDLNLEVNDILEIIKLERSREWMKK